MNQKTASLATPKIRFDDLMRAVVKVKPEASRKAPKAKTRKK